MYIFELIAKLKNRKKSQKPVVEERQEVLEEENCNHNFAPLDSTKKYFACTKCGLVVEGKDLKDINFFKS
ncbi:hypothetical protein IJC60_05995 [bacterium]|nr:hypothetical protein [bacterium]